MSTMLRIGQLAERWTVCERTIKRWAAEGHIPAPLGFSRVLLWRLADIEAFESNGGPAAKEENTAFDSQCERRALA